VVAEIDIPLIICLDLSGKFIPTDTIVGNFFPAIVTRTEDNCSYLMVGFSAINYLQ
jgi:hypothetical protein